MADGPSAHHPHTNHLSYRATYDLERVRGFSDCVFAVAITIVVITFDLPNREADNEQLARDLLNEWPRYLSYLAAFAVIGYSWVTHHQLFEVLRRVDTTAVWLNLAMLSFIVLTPYPMQLIGLYRELSTPYVLFNLDAFAFGFLNFLLIVYATKDGRLISHRWDPTLVRVMRLRTAVFPLALGVAAVLAVPFGAWSVVAWALVPVGRAVLRRRFGSTQVWAAEVDADAPDSDAGSSSADESVANGEARRVGASSGLAPVFSASGSMARLVGFSDNVYAFAITLLVLQLTLPSDAVDNEALREAVIAQIHPELIGFFIGFAVIGLLWTIHHRDFIVIERQDATLRTLNLMHLMFIAVLPFATLVLSSYDRFVTATVLYAVCAGLASSSLLVVFVYAASNHRLIDAAIPTSEVREREVLGAVPSLGFLLSIPVAFASPALAQLVWALPITGQEVFRLRQSWREGRAVPPAS